MNKAKLREVALRQRLALSSKRRSEAKQAAMCLLQETGTLLSYSAIKGELDLCLLNQQLAKEGRLALPRVHNDRIVLHSVTNLEKELVKSSWGILEPDPTICPPLSADDINLVLVPALAFNKENHRLGYGKGHYDYFFATYPTLRSIGVGFTEQLVELLPVEPHDHPLNRLLLF